MSRQQRPRGRKRVFIGAMIAAAILSLGAVATITGAFPAVRGLEFIAKRMPPVRHVELRGDLRHLDDRRARRLIEPVLGGSLLALDMADVRSRLESHPWVARAVVVRVWPDRLRVRLVERVPVARWGDYQLIDAQGHRFDPDGERREDLPKVHGSTGQERNVLAMLDSVLERLSPLGLQLLELTLDERRAWRIRLGGGAELRLGRESLERRLDRFVAAYAPLLASRMGSVDAVDLRYTNGFAVSWKPTEDGAGKFQEGGSGPNAQKG